MTNSDHASVRGLRSTMVQSAEILGEMSTMIEALGVQLCLDPVVAGAHGAELQAIDHTSQKLRAIADLLQADCQVSALSNIGLDEIRVRFKHLTDYPDCRQL